MIADSSLYTRDSLKFTDDRIFFEQAPNTGYPIGTLLTLLFFKVPEMLRKL